MDRVALSPLLRSFERHLRAENRSEHTIASYLDSLCQAEAFLAGRGRTVVDARREDLEAFLGELLQRRAPETVATRYRRLRVLYRWLEEEDEITANPMAKMKPPIIPEQPVPVVPEDGLRRLLATCDGKSFEDRRDTALILLLLDVGPRRAELAIPPLRGVERRLTLHDVIQSGRLPMGSRLETVYMGHHHTAELLADGQIRFQDETYGWLSSAGVAVKQAVRGPDIPESIRAPDGWSFWRATDAKAGDTVTLKLIRQRVAADHTA